MPHIKMHMKSVLKHLCEIHTVRVAASATISIQCPAKSSSDPFGLIGKRPHLHGHIFKTPSRLISAMELKTARVSKPQES